MVLCNRVVSLFCLFGEAKTKIKSISTQLHTGELGTLYNRRQNGNGGKDDLST
jgi:hypothetical protein